MLRCIFAVLISVAVAGCVTTVVTMNDVADGKIQSAANAAMGVKPETRLHLAVINAQRLDSRGGYKSYSCSAQSFEFRFGQDAVSGFRNRFEQKFLLTDDDSAENRILIDIGQPSYSMKCKPVLGVACTGTAYLSLKVRFEAAGKAPNEVDLWARSESSEGSYTVFCTAPGDERRKNVTSAFAQLIEELEAESDKYFGVPPS